MTGTHTELARLLAGLDGGPGDEALWLVIADWLDENGEAERAELARLGRRLLRGMPEDDDRWQVEGRVRALVNGGVRPCVPEIVNSVGMRFALIPPGAFWMGSPEDEAGRQPEEVRHRVTLTRPFWMGAFAVTQSQYEAVMGKNPSGFSPRGEGKDWVVRVDTGPLPVESLTWDEAVAFCEALSSRREEQAGRRSYRLPTEAEWEHSCRAGLISGAYHFGNVLDQTRAAYGALHPRPRAVGGYNPNAWGLHDMHGGVWEWCADWLDVYHSGPVVDPAGPDRGAWRVARGGSYHSTAADCRSASRLGVEPDDPGNTLGFRALFTLPE